jgi:hypothetical protein
MTAKQRLEKLEAACKELVAAHERRHPTAKFWTLNEKRGLALVTECLRRER